MFGSRDWFFLFLSYLLSVLFYFYQLDAIIEVLYFRRLLFLGFGFFPWGFLSSPHFSALHIGSAQIRNQTSFSIPSSWSSRLPFHKIYSGPASSFQGLHFPRPGLLSLFRVRLAILQISTRHSRGTRISARRSWNLLGERKRDIIYTDNTHNDYSDTLTSHLDIIHHRQ